MATGPDARRWWRADLAWGLGTALASLLLALLALHIWDADLRVPFSYGGDALHNLTIVKGVLEHGWYQHNPSLGAPFGLKLFDFPVVSGDNLQIVLMKIIGIFTSDSALVVNLFFLLVFPLSAATAFACMRLLGISRPAAAAGATLFALLPAHFLHGETHLFISAYYAVPIGAYLALRALAGEPFGRRRSTLVLVLLACIVVGSAHVYYAAFSITLLAVAAVVRLVTGPWRSAGTAALLIVLIGAVVALNHLPNVIYQAEHGKNVATQRPAAESESYGLKIAQMVLPVEHHRIGSLAHLRARYDADGTQLQEGDPQALGIVGTLGFLGLLVFGLAALAGRRPRAGPHELPLALVILTLAAVLVGTVGGFSSVFSYVVTAQLRAWGRIAVFIGFFSLAAVAVAADRFAARRPGRPALVLLAVVVVIGFLDQTNAGLVPDYKGIKADYRSDAAFVTAIENRLPAGASVFELPYEPFPEPQPAYIPPAGPYDMARGYLHSRDLRWSYGLMKGRAGDWQAAVVELPPALLARAVVAAGFSGIYLDRNFFADHGAHALAALQQETGAQALSSPDGRLAFLDLRPYAQRLRAGRGGLAALRGAVLRPVSAGFREGFSPVQQDATGRSYRAAGNARIVIDSAAKQARSVTFSFAAKPAYPAAARLTLLLPDGSKKNLSVPAAGTEVRLALSVPPGGSAILLIVHARPQYGLPDATQPYYLRVLNPLVVDDAFSAFGAPPKDRRAASWLEPFGTT